jgi:hypothetical protein
MSLWHLATSACLWSSLSVLEDRCIYFIPIYGPLLLHSILADLPSKHPIWRPPWVTPSPVKPPGSFPLSSVRVGTETPDQPLCALIPPELVTLIRNSWDTVVFPHHPEPHLSKPL